jgi:hypothetical protein
MDFQWKQDGDKWILEPAIPNSHTWRITVETVDHVFWSIYAAGTPMELRYTSEQGAKLDAWQFLTSKAKTLLGIYAKPRLISASKYRMTC